LRLAKTPQAFNSLMARELIELPEKNEYYIPPRERAVRGGEKSSPGDDRDREKDNSIRPQRVRSRNTDPVTIELEQELDEDAQFLRTEKRVPVRRTAIPKKTAKQFKLAAIVVGGAMVLFAMGTAAYGYGMHSWRFRIESSDSIEISGVHNASRAHVMEIAGADIGRNIFFMPLDERKRQLETIPWVQSATVMRLWPNRVAVQIQERTPVAFAQIGSRINLIDANGVVMGMPANRQTRYSFPVIHGITETEPLSSRFAAMKIYNRLAGELDSPDASGPHYMRQLSEVDLSDPENLKVTANEGGGTLLIHLGGSNFLERYKLYVSHIGEWRQQFQNLQSVDLRYEGQIIVNPDKPAEAEAAPERKPEKKPVVEAKKEAKKNDRRARRARH
jgi:cell division protein FtsQ